MAAPPTALLILAGPAGVGKSTLCDRLVRDVPAFERVITATTRPPRANELDVAALLKARGFLMSAVAPDAIRIVTHLDVDRAACVAAAAALAEAIEGLAT